MRSMALVVVMPRERESELNQDTLEIIRTEIKKELPHINFYPGSATSGSKRHAIVYTMANMAGLPERAKIYAKKQSDFSVNEKRENDKLPDLIWETSLNHRTVLEESADQQVRIHSPNRLCILRRGHS